MIVLPKGLFIFKRISNIKSENINDLIQIGNNLKRKIDIITDIEINKKLLNNNWVNIVDKPSELYDYIFVVDKIELAYNIYQEYSNFLNENHWFGYMLPIKNTAINYEQLNINKFKEIGYDAAIFPKVSSVLGGNMIIYFNNLQIKDNCQILTQIERGKNSIIWGNIFRACGFFNGTIKLEEHELQQSL